MTGVSVRVLIPHSPPFEEADFYPHGPHGVLARIEGPCGTYFVERQGESDLQHEDGRRLRTATDYRAAFPDGTLPEDGGAGWRFLNNGWFAVVSATDPGGNHDQPCESYAGALETAIESAAHAAAREGEPQTPATQPRRT